MTSPIGPFCLAKTCPTPARILDFLALALATASGIGLPFGFLWNGRPSSGIVGSPEIRLEEAKYEGCLRARRRYRQECVQLGRARWFRRHRVAAASEEGDVDRSRGEAPSMYHRHGS